MTGRESTQLTVELLPDFIDSAGARHFLAGAGGRLLTRFAATEEQDRLRITVEDDDSALALVEWQGLLDAITTWAGAEARSAVVIAPGAPLLQRHAARWVGFAGRLRGELIRDLRAPRSAARNDGPALPLRDRFVADLNFLLPGLT